MTEQKPWWTPELLAEQEQAVRSGSDDRSGDIRNDFGSYKALAASNDPITSGLYLHNEVDRVRIDGICSDYLRLLSKKGMKSPRTIADLGCGAGFTTSGLMRQWPNAQIQGFDVSQDAIDVARSRWPECQFVQGAVQPNRPLADTPFDFLLCQEFYPFTRTRSTHTHREWLSFLQANLNRDGVAIITVSSATSDSISHSYRELRDEFRLQRIFLAAPRISRKIPFTLSGWAGRVLSLLKPEWARSVYLMTQVN